MVRVDRRKRVRLALIEPIEDDDTDDTCPTSTTPETTSHLVAEFPTAPKAFLCPLTLSIMMEPVLDGQGNSFEKKAILKWLKKNTISPISRRPLHEGMLIPNHALREVIHEYMGPAWVERKAGERECDEGNESDEEIEAGQRSLCPYRRRVNRLLRFATSHTHDDTPAEGLGLKLSEEGSAAFRYEDIVVVLDVPKKVGLFHLYTRGLIRDPTEDMKERLLELNFMQGKAAQSPLFVSVAFPSACLTSKSILFRSNSRGVFVHQEIVQQYI